MWLGSPLKRQCLGTGKNPLKFTLPIQTCRNWTDTLASFHTYQCLPCKEIQHKPLIYLIHIWCVLHSLHGFILIFPNTHTHTHAQHSGAHIAPCCGTCLSGERPEIGHWGEHMCPAHYTFLSPSSTLHTWLHRQLAAIFPPTLLSPLLPSLCSFSFHSCNTWIFRLI